MEALLNRVDELVNQIAKENHVPLEEPKHNILVLTKKTHNQNKNVTWVKWNRLIIIESLTGKEHGKSRID